MAGGGGVPIGFSALMEFPMPMGFPTLFMAFVGGWAPMGFPAFIILPEPPIGFIDDMAAIG